MAESFRQIHAPRRDSFPADPARFCPPDPRARGSELVDENLEPTGEHIGSLAEWLGRITPPGAPVVPILNVRELRGPGCVPLIREYVQAERRPAVWPRQKRDAEILQLVPVGIVRPARGEAPRPRDGLPRWYMEAAYFRDLWGKSEQEVAAGIEASCSEDFSRGREPDSRTARRWTGQGRQILADLGAWPWCLRSAGKLEPRWWRERRYAEVLAVWHFRVFEDALSDLLAPVQYAAGDRARWRRHNREAAADLYRAQFAAFSTDRNEPTPPDPVVASRHYGQSSNSQRDAATARG